MGSDRESTLRDRTRDELFELIRANPGITRGLLAERSGASRSTVNHAVGRLLAAGRVREAEAAKGNGSGRPAVGLEVAPGKGAVAGIDFGHGHVAVAIADSRGSILAEEWRDVDVDLEAEPGIDYAADAVRRLAAAHLPGDEGIALVVAGIPGPVEECTGVVRSPTILSSWVGLVPAEELRRRLGVRVHVHHDTVLGAWGEHRHGAARGHEDFLYVKASGGIGASLVLGGSIYQGSRGLAGEIGHTQLAGHTELCRCGNRGCLEAVVSVEAIRAQFAHIHRGLDPATVDLGAHDDPISLRVLNEAGRTLGRALAAMCNLLNPEAVVVGGLLGATSPVFVDGVRSAIRRHGLPATSDELVVLPAALGRRAELVGAVEMAAQQLVG